MVKVLDRVKAADRVKVVERVNVEAMVLIMLTSVDPSGTLHLTLKLSYILTSTKDYVDAEP